MRTRPEGSTASMGRAGLAQLSVSGSSRVPFKLNKFNCLINQLKSFASSSRIILWTFTCFWLLISLSIRSFADWQSSSTFAGASITFGSMANVYCSSSTFTMVSLKIGILDFSNATIAFLTVAIRVRSRGDGTASSPPSA
jgi:hypothetical protein